MSSLKRRRRIKAWPAQTLSFSSSNSSSSTIITFGQTLLLLMPSLHCRALPASRSLFPATPTISPLHVLLPLLSSQQSLLLFPNSSDIPPLCRFHPTAASLRLPRRNHPARFMASASHNVESQQLVCNPLKVHVAGSLVDIIPAPGLADVDLRRAIDSTPFKQWLSNLNNERGILKPAKYGGASCTLKRVVIQSVDMFGQRVGFVKFKADVIDDATGKLLPGIVFARGGAVAILMLLESDGEVFVVLTEQARVPVGRVILELPAGMLDDDGGDFVGTAAREVEEEIGIRIKTADLVNLTDFLDDSTGKIMFPSPGGCDEGITLMLYRSHVKKEAIDALKGQKTGLEEHGEIIKVHVVPYHKLWRSTADAKALAAITIYEMAKREGLLPSASNTPASDL